MSGHSKWSTIKRQKGSADAKRGQLFTKLSNSINIAVKSGGGDPDTNFKLRLAIDRAKMANMPKESIKRAIEKGLGKSGGEVGEFVYEGFAPGGIAVIVEAITDNKQRTVAEIKNIFDKNGGTLGEVGSVTYLFSKKAEIATRIKDKTSEELLNLGLETGAEDVVEEDENAFYYTSVSNMQLVKEALEKKGLEVESAEIIYMPISPIPTNQEELAAKVNNLIEKLEELDDVQAVYTNLLD